MNSTSKSTQIKLKKGRLSKDLFDGTVDDLYAEYTHFRTLAELAAQITSDLSIEAVLENILDALNKHTGAERSLILIFDRSGEIVFQKGRNLKQAEIQEPSFEVSWSIIKKTCDVLHPLCIQNALEDDDFKMSRSVLRLRILSVICVPIVHQDQLIGVFYADNRNALGIFHENECSLVHQSIQFIASPLSTLLQNIELKQDLERAQQQIQNRDTFAEILGNSPKLIAVLNLVKQVAATFATVLIHGESGTGKELVARAIHQNSDRKAQPFISLNCGALPENLLESELFGHVKGAFTGAQTDKKGWFETANGGTIFFDEISEMSKALQVKLLRVLQNGEYAPVGSTRVKHCDVRILAATNVKLERLVEEGSFRQDLYYRLNIITLHLPQLKERREDIVLLAHHFLAKHGRPDLQLARETQRLLQQYDFPGNVRELENMMQRATVLCRGKTLLVEHLPPEVLERAEAPRQWGKFAEEKAQVLEEFERRYIKAALKRSQGNVSQAARTSGMDAKNFYQKMIKYRIVASAYKPK